VFFKAPLNYGLNSFPPGNLFDDFHAGAFSPSLISQAPPIFPGRAKKFWSVNREVYPRHLSFKDSYGWSVT